MKEFPTPDDFLAAFEEGARKEAERKALEPVPKTPVKPKSLGNGRFFTVRSKRTGEWCFASWFPDKDPEGAGNYQVVRYIDKRTKWVSYADLLVHFEVIDSNPKPCSIDWISPDYKTKAIPDDEDILFRTGKQIAEERAKQNEKEESKVA